jgi:Fe-S-cluster-containing hydrogenase component 2
MPADTLYRRLQRHLDRMPVGFPASESGVEIRILQQLFSPEQAAVALELSAIPEPPATIHKRLKSKMTLPQLIEMLEQMASKGILLRLGGRGGFLYGKLMFAVGMYERQLPRLTAEFQRDSVQYLHGEFARAFHNKKTTQMRVVPVNKIIPVERNTATYDDIRAYVESTPGPFATMKCICRHGMDLLGEKCRQTDLRENCLTFGHAAKWMAAEGMGRLIGREQMLGLLDAADKEGLVLQPENTRHPLFVCCCCHCCCGVLNSAKKFPRPADYFSSNFTAKVDASQCQSCGTCETRCQMEAIVTSEDGTSAVDESRCIGCALCITTCPSEAVRMEPKTARKETPDDTRALYLKLLQERYGPWGMAALAARKILGMKI